MSSNKTPVAIAIGAALAGGLTLAGSAFAMQPLATGYMATAASVAEGACGADKAKAEGGCGAAKGAKTEGKCGMDAMDADKDGRVSKAEFTAMHQDGDGMFAMHDGNGDGFITAEEMKATEGKCGADKGGEGKCGGAKAATPGTAAAGAKAGMEGKCGEGKCGSN